MVMNKKQFNGKVAAIKNRAADVHANVNQMYDGHPYSYHLTSVAENTTYILESNTDKFGDVLNDLDTYLTIIFGAFFHDSIEGARLTFDDVHKIALEYMDEPYAIQATEIVYALTNEKGRNRAERANDNYYAGIRITMYAGIIKLAARMSNAIYSKNNGSSMYEAYRKDMPHFLKSIGVSYDIVPAEVREELGVVEYDDDYDKGLKNATDFVMNFYGPCGLGYKLCYVKDGAAYFTPKELSEQWGDDWDDVPYEHNASEPTDYTVIKAHKTDNGLGVVDEKEQYGIEVIKFDSQVWKEPCDGFESNSPYSVKDINSGAIAWLRNDQTCIMAGATIPEFLAKCKKVGCKVYLSVCY